MTRRVIRLTGERVPKPPIPAEILSNLLSVLIDGSKRVVRLKLEGRSTARGKAPIWLDSAADFRVGLEEGSTCIVVEAPALRDAFPEKFAQQALFGGVDPDYSSVDYLVDSLRDAAAGKDESELLDGPLIETFSQLDRVLKRGVSALEFDWNGQLKIEPRSIQIIDQMKRRTPPSQQVRVSGKLEMIQHTERRFMILQEAGPIHGIAEERVSPKDLASLWGQHVTVSGTAHFRPSGSLLRIDAESVRAAEGDVSLWARRPTPLLEAEKTTDLHRAQGPKSGLSAIFGKWPGDEDDQTIEEALSDLS